MILDRLDDGPLVRAEWPCNDWDTTLAASHKLVDIDGKDGLAILMPPLQISYSA